MKWLSLLLLVLILAAPARAQDTGTVEIEMDLELLLAVDVSRSMSPAELEIQRRGYASALTSPEVIRAIEGGLLGRIALTYVEWAGQGSQRVIVPWTPIRNAAEAQAVADRISSFYVSSLRRTSISDALTYAAGAFDDNGYLGLRRVIDISGDGPNNMGAPVLEAREAALAKGIIINGLPLMTQDALSNLWGIEDLDIYYTRCVIGGPGAFVIPVTDWSQFADAVRRKLVQEIAARPTPTPTPPTERVIRAQAQPAYDCLVGERMWEQRRTYFDIP